MRLWYIFALFTTCLSAQREYPYRSVSPSPFEDFPFLPLRVPNSRSLYKVDPVALTITLPLYEGASRDGPVWFIITEASTREMSELLRVHFSPSLAFATSTKKAGFRNSHFEEGRLYFDTGFYVDFQPTRVLEYDDSHSTSFPPKLTRPGSFAEISYNPIVRLPDGSFINAPIIAKVGAQEDDLVNADVSIVHDRVVKIDVSNSEVTLALSSSFIEGTLAFYLCTEASDAGIAALERATFAPGLKNIPVYAPGKKGYFSTTFVTTSSSFAIVNGIERGPHRQGYNTMHSDPRVGIKASPLNVFSHSPDLHVTYSPLHNLHLVEWTSEAISAGNRTQLTSVAAVLNFHEHGMLSGPLNTIFASSGIVLNCPVVPW